MNEKYFEADTTTQRLRTLKNVRPSQWWNEIRKISGMIPATPTANIRSQLHIDGLSGKSNKDIADLINSVLLEPVQEYQPLYRLPAVDSDSEVPTLDDVSLVQSALSRLNLRKACGPDGVPNWILKDFAEILANPVCAILNSSFAEQTLPSSWKHANVITLPNL